MKKTLITLGSALFVVIGAWAQTIFTSGNLRYRVTNESYGQVTVYGYVNQPTGKLEIPDLVMNGSETYRVDAIAANTFANCTAITQVIIPSMLGSIGAGAFLNCTALRHVIVMRDTPPYLSETAFNTTNLQIYVPEHGKESYMESPIWSTFGELKSSIFTDDQLRYQIIDAIDRTVAVWGTNYTTLPDSVLNVPANTTANGTTYTVKRIRQNALSNKDNVTEINLPEGITAIEKSAFSSCANLRKVTLPNSVTYMGEAIFSSCQSLMEVNIPEGITAIENYMFFFCKSLRTLHIPDNVTTIKSEVFDTCEKLTEISFAGLTPPTLETNALWGIDLESLTIHVPYEAVTAYRNATGWSEVTNIEPLYNAPIIVDKVKYIIDYYGAELVAYLQEPTGALVIPSTIRHNSQNHNVTKIAKCAFLRNYDITEVTIPNSINYIKSKAFWLCNELTTVNIGSGLEVMEDMVFHYCDKLEQFNVDNQNLYYSSPNGELIDTYSGALLKYPAVKTDTTYTLPNNVIYIEGYAFMDNNSLRHITIHNSTPVIAHEKGFSGIEDRVTVHVTGAALPVYQAAEPWKNLNLQTIKVTHDGLIYEVTDMMNQTAKLVGYETAPTGILDIPATISYEGVNLSVTAMKSYLFNYHNQSTTQINIPATLTNIDNNNFGTSPTNLACIQVDSANTAYCSEDGILFNKDKTILIKYPKKKPETTYNIPESVTTIAKNAFESCFTLTEINIPESVNTIGEYAFESCNSLTHIRIPEGVTTIENSTFRGCFDLTEINIPNSVTLIDDYAFHNCRAATKLTLGKNLTEISSGAFYSCIALEEIKILATTPPTVRVDDVFENVNRNIPVYVPEAALTAYQTANVWNEFINLQAMQTVFTVDNLVYEITDLGNREVKLINYENLLNGPQVIPATVINDGTTYTITSMREDVFFDNKTVTEFIVDEANLICSSENGVLFNKDKTVLIQYPIGNSATTYTVPSTVTSIGGTAFYRCAALTQVILPEGLTSIGESAFYWCPALTTVNIPASVTSIEAWAFSSTALTEVTLPEGLTSIEEGVFSGCSTITEMTVLATTPPALGDNAFHNVNRDIPVYVPATALTAYQAANVWNEFTYLQAMSTTFSVDGLTYNITDADARTVEIIGYTMGLPDVLDIPATVTNNGINYNVTSIGADAIWGIDDLTEVSIPNSITTIGENVFWGCCYMTKVTIGSGVTSIGAGAFALCEGLTEMTVLATVPPTVGDDTFGGVGRDIPVYVPAASLADYQAADVWKEFNLQALPTTGLQTPSMPESIRMEGGMLHNPQGLHLTIYDMQGRQVYGGNDATISLTAGVYVMRCNNASCKVVF